MGKTNSEFELKGINHVALVSSDMARTVDFYTNVLGMPLVKTVAIPGNGQHFFFDCGNGDCVAFFYFPNAPQAAPGIASPATLIGDGDIATAIASMNHLAFNVDADRFEDYVERLKAKGVKCSAVFNHDESESTVSKTMHPGVFIRSVYFFDPDGILLEFATWTRVLNDADVRHEAARPLAATV
jgi:catechol 2,3-dioxygenase-like lactoylglutathione lyase family enzyme